MTFVSYLRVSTEKQEASGLGLEAQRQAVAHYVASHSARRVDGTRGGDVMGPPLELIFQKNPESDLIAEFVEIESGAKSDRPQLQAAMHRAKVTGSVLLVAKLDRLSRDPDFLGALMTKGVDFQAVDNPNANKLTVRILAAMAEHEREMISRRTKEALAALKAQGVKLGNPNGAAALRRAKPHDRGVVSRQTTATERAEGARADIGGAILCGARTYAQIAEVLNANRVKAPRGGRWLASTARRATILLGLREGGHVVRPARVEGDVAYLTLTKGYEAVIDAADLPLVGGYNWYAETTAYGDLVYARRAWGRGADKGSETLHRALMKPPADMVVDHRDGDGLNCRRYNMRVCTHTQNLQNSRTRVNPHGKGVHPRGDRFIAVITINGKITKLGKFKTAAEAKAAYDAAALEHFGEFARP
jgi:DNA invertase Pin-like site-specific DNA recombinase